MFEKCIGERSFPVEQQETVEAEVQARWRSSSHHELHRISCEFHEGVVTLHGRVSSFYLKQVAQALLGELGGIDQISNRLEVAALPSSR